MKKKDNNIRCNINNKCTLLLFLMLNQLASFAQYKFCIENNNEKFYIEVDMIDDPRTQSLFNEIIKAGTLPVNIAIEKKHTSDNKKTIEPKVWVELFGAFDKAILNKLYNDFEKYTLGIQSANSFNTENIKTGEDKFRERLTNPNPLGNSSNISRDLEQSVLLSKRISDINYEIDKINLEKSKYSFKRYEINNNTTNALKSLNTALWFQISPESKYNQSKKGYRTTVDIVDEDAYYLCISKTSLKFHPWSGHPASMDIKIIFNYLKKNTHDENEIVLGKVNKKYSKKLQRYFERIVSESKSSKDTKDNVYKKTEWNVKSYCVESKCPDNKPFYPLIYEHWVSAYITHINSINAELDVLEKQISEARKKIEHEKVERARLMAIREFKPTTNGFEIINGYNEPLRKVNFTELNNDPKYGRVLTLACHLNDQKSKEYYALTYFTEILNIIIRKGYVDKQGEQFIKDGLLKKINYQFLIDAKILLEANSLHQIETPTLGKYVLMEYAYSMDNIGILLTGELVNNNIKNGKINGILEYEILSRIEFDYLTNLTFVLKNLWVNSFDYSVEIRDFGKLNTDEKYRYRLEVTTCVNETLDSFYFYLNQGLAHIHRLGTNVALNSYYGYYKVEIEDKYNDQHSFPLVVEVAYNLRTLEGVNIVRALFDDWHDIKYPTGITDGHFLIPTNSYMSSSLNMPNIFCSYSSSENAARLLIKFIRTNNEVYSFYYNYDVFESHYLVIDKFSIHKGGRHQVVRKEDSKNPGYVSQYIMFPVIFYGTLDEAHKYLQKINNLSGRVWSIASSSSLSFLSIDNRNLLQGYTNFWVSDTPKGEHLSSSSWFLNKSDYGVVWGKGRANNTSDLPRHNKVHVIFQ